MQVIGACATSCLIRLAARRSMPLVLRRRHKIVLSCVMHDLRVAIHLAHNCAGAMGYAVRLLRAYCGSRSQSSASSTKLRGSAMRATRSSSSVRLHYREAPSLSGAWGVSQKRLETILRRLGELRPGPDASDEERLRLLLQRRMFHRQMDRVVVRGSVEKLLE